MTFRLALPRLIGRLHIAFANEIDRATWTHRTVVPDTIPNYVNEDVDLP